MNNQGLAPRRVVDRVLARVAMVEGCWVSQYHPHRKTGYARVGWSENGKVDGDGVHRIVWAYFYGPIPNGLVVNHICKVRRCVNIQHLNLKTRSDNSRDGINIYKTHCPRGHPYSGDNLMISKGGKRGRPGRVCKTCKNLLRRNAYHERKAANV